MSPSNSPESGQVVNQEGGSPSPSLIQPEQAPQESPWAFWRSVLITLAVALGIRQFLVEARYIPSGSMLPGLQLQDRLLVEKLSYRQRSPRRGDLVVGFTIRVPEQLTARQRELYTELASIEGDPVHEGSRSVWAKIKDTFTG